MAVPVATTKPITTVGQAAVAPTAGLTGLDGKASRTLPSGPATVSPSTDKPKSSGTQPSGPPPKSTSTASQIPAGALSPPGELRGVAWSPQPSHEELMSGRMPSVRFDTATTVLYEGAELAQVTAVPTNQPSSKKPVRIKRPSELPYLRLPKFTLAPLRIIGLLRPRASRPRKQPTLRELLREAQIKEQDRLNLDTKERERHLTVVVVVMVLFVYYLAFAVSAYYYELADITPATPSGRRFPIELLRSTVNGSSD